MSVSLRREKGEDLSLITIVMTTAVKALSSPCLAPCHGKKVQPFVHGAYSFEGFVAK